VYDEDLSVSFYLKPNIISSFLKDVDRLQANLIACHQCWALHVNDIEVINSTMNSMLMELEITGFFGLCQLSGILKKLRTTFWKLESSD
jgi:hypothetical protein